MTSRLGLQRGTIISFSGVDGSGKSTQIRLLQERLDQLNIRTQRVWCRWRPIASLPLLMILRKLGYAKIHPTSSIGFVETRIPGNFGLEFLWATLVQIDNLLKTGAMIAIPMLLGRAIICDRYILDLMVEGMADLNDGRRANRLGFRFLKSLPRPRHSFMVRVGPDIAYKRKPDMPTLHHFQKRTQLYDELAKTLGVTVLDGTLPPDEIHKEIWKILTRND